MTGDGVGAHARAAELRRSFDRSFAEAPQTDATPQDDLLAIGVGPDPYAVRLTDIASLLADRPVTRLPGSAPALLGVVGRRGVVLPVYDFRALLGYPTGAVPRWLVVAAHAAVGFAFDQFRGHLQVPRETVSSGPATEARPPYVREVVRTQGLAYPIIHMPSVLEAIENLAQQRVRPKE